MITPMATTPSSSAPFFADITTRRGRVYPGANPSRFVELVGGKAVAMLFHDPDPKTFRAPYYYNSRVNVLFKKVTVSNPITKKKSIYWQAVGGC